MQLPKSFLDRSDRSFPPQDAGDAPLAADRAALQPSRKIFTMYSNQVYLAHGNYDLPRRRNFYFGKPVTDLKLQEAALLAGMVRGPLYSSAQRSQRALARRNWCYGECRKREKLTPPKNRLRGNAARLHVQISAQRPGALLSLRNSAIPRSSYGTEAVAERGLRV